MSGAAQTTNGAATPAGESQLHYTLVSHLNTKEASSQQPEALTSRTSARKKTTMDEAIPTSSPLLSLSDSPVASAKDHELQAPLGTRLSANERVTSQTDNGKIALSSEEVSPGAPSVTALEMSKNQSDMQSNKRTREEHTDEDTQTKLKKPATETEVTAPDESTEDNGDDIAAENDASSAKPDKSARKSKPKSKPAPKKAAASRRGRACDACRKRKVKCTHVVEEHPDGESNPATNPSPDDAANKEEKPTKPTEADENEALAQVDSADNDDGLHEAKPAKKSKAKKKPAPKPTNTPAERTSTRNRKAPERFDALQELPAPRVSPPKKATGKVFDPIYITTNSTSRLGKADIYHMLLEDEAWTSLSAEQQATLVSMLPATTENQRLLAQIRAGDTDNTRPQYLRASDIFRDEVAKFKDDLTNGHLAKTWQAAAEQAVVERAAGEYDAWKAEEAELWWGQKGN